ncbi:MAG: carbohydrate ABC transporter permease [Hyphomicrobiaceae bacterium]|nr:carbohydrate ABC transporter permease [Hyphomicrobiaceae bacterium]
MGGVTFREALGRWWAAWLVLGVLTAMSIYPFVFVLITAFKTKIAYNKDPIGLPAEPTLEYLERALTSGNMLGYLGNSIIVVGAAVLLLLIFASMAGYALSVLRFRGSNLIFMGILALLAVPAAVVMIPLYRTVGQLGLVNTHFGLILTYTALQLPFSIFLMTSYFNGLPREIIEAADMDGATRWQVFRTIALPLSFPALSTMATLNFLWLFNELLFALLIMQDDANRTLPVGLATLQGQNTTPVPLLAAGLLISMVPVLAVFFVAQRELSRGVTAGAIK